MVARKRLIVTVYVHCLSCSIYVRYPDSLTTVTRLRDEQPGGRSSVLSRGSIQTVSGKHPSLYPVDAGGKVAKGERLPPSSTYWKGYEWV